jgi:holo-[acyl-carrier protein] synthase
VSIVGLGIEVVEVDRFGAALARRPERLAERLFTPGERAYAAARGRRGAESLAVRFAAKCAARRALGAAGPGAVRWHEIEVVRGRTGAPTLRFAGAAAARAAGAGVARVSLTLTHDRSACLAHVVLEGER